MEKRRIVNKSKVCCALKFSRFFKICFHRKFVILLILESDGRGDFLASSSVVICYASG